VNVRRHFDVTLAPVARGKVVAVVLAVLTSAGAQGQVVSPRVTTDASVDCHTLESIVADVCKGLETDHQKAIALFHFTRRMLYHYPQRTDPMHADVLTMINTYGYSFCSQQAMVLVTLWDAAGIEGELLAVPGHVTAQAHYDGAKHWFDPLIGAYVLQRDGKTAASIDQIAADRTLLTDAVKQGRVGPGFVTCRTVLRDDAARFCKHNPQYVSECASHVDDVTFMANLASEAHKVSWWHGPEKSRYQPDIKLRRGEKVTYLWDNLPGECNVDSYKPGEPPRANVVPFGELPPHHFCGAAAEKLEEVNYGHFKPYTKTVNGAKTGRYQANGHHVVVRSFARRPLEGDFQTNTFTWAPKSDDLPALRATAKGQAAVLACRMTTPHVYTSATVSAVFARATIEDVNRIYLSKRVWDSRTRSMVTSREKIWQSPPDSAAGDSRADVKIAEQIVNNRDVVIEFECRTEGRPDEAGLKSVEIDAVFQHNMFARPYLAAGANRVTVRTALPEQLMTNDLTLTYAWVTGASPLQTDTKKITFSPTTYTIDVAGEEMPKMVSMELAVAE
jgi:hypothetical protein